MPGSPVVAQPPCPKCGYLADPAAGAVNFCPKCGVDLRAEGRPEPAASGSSPWLGAIIAERYRLRALLGEGGMGAVYQAEHIRMGKALALKILRGDFARQPGAVARFRAEAQIVSRLSHPNTIAVFDFGEIGDAEAFYLAMEYVPGRDLAAILKTGGRLPEGRAAALGAQILGSLAEAHDAGIVHRDVKPGNVMVMRTRTGEDFVKVLDFGIAKWRDDKTASPADTSAGAIIGTPNYLSPEQARGDPLDARADLYSVGALLYELVAGRPPFVAPNPMAVVAAHLHQAPPPLADLAPVSSRFAEIVHRALEKRPDARFESADAMRAALLAFGASQRATPAPAPARARAVTPTPGDLGLASRDDFRDLERQLRSLRRSRVAGPLTVLLLAGAVGGAIWKWEAVHAELSARAPGIAARLPAAFRPGAHYDGLEHEPNDAPARANALPLPAGERGAPGAGVALIRGRVGARRSASEGDVDVYRVEVPPGAPGQGAGRTVLVADWSGAAEGDGIRGLDVTLTLNRAPEPGRSSAPLVGVAERGGPGHPERLVVAVEPGTYWLAVRERHDEGDPPVEKPTDVYALRVRLAEPAPGEEVEPNDAPVAADGQPLRWAAWRALAMRNPVAAGAAVRADASAPDAADTFALVAAAGGAAPLLALAIPDEGLALAARVWVPDGTDLEPGGAGDRVRFAEAAEGGPGAVLAIPLAPAPGGAPVLVALRSEGGEGRYELLALDGGEGSAAAIAGRVRALAESGRTAAALELAAAFVRHVPAAPGRASLLLLAGELAERAAAAQAPDADLRAFTRAGLLLGAEVLEPTAAGARYGGAFEARVAADDALAEDAALRLVPRAPPCTAAEVAARAATFVARFPASTRASEALLWKARAAEELFWRAGAGDAAQKARAVEAYRAVNAAAGTPAAAEVEARLAALASEKPDPASAPRVCW